MITSHPAACPKPTKKRRQTCSCANANFGKQDKPDAIFAKMLQEPLGGQWGEISVMMTYLFQGWSCRGPQKYRDMIMDIATEEIGHDLEADLQKGSKSAASTTRPKKMKGRGPGYSMKKVPWRQL